METAEQYMKLIYSKLTIMPLNEVIDVVVFFHANFEKILHIVMVFSSLTFNK